MILEIGNGNIWSCHPFPHGDSPTSFLFKGSELYFLLKKGFFFFLNTVFQNVAIKIRIGGF